jgi:hypothetical protein
MARPRKINPVETDTACTISLFCIVCEYNKHGHCERLKIDVPKLKQSAVEWPK